MTARQEFVSVTAKVIQVVLLLLLGTSFSWAQSDMSLIIEPKHPDTNSEVMFTVTGTPCFYGSVSVDSENFRIDVEVSAWFQRLVDACLVNHPAAPDFSQVIPPLDAGEYHVALRHQIGGHLIDLVETRTLVVEPAEPGLPEGGINGLYFNPDSDGHYVNVMQFNGGTLILWNTFDPNGAQVMIYAVGELNEDRSAVLDAPAWTNVGGRVGLDGTVEAAEVEHWGTLSIQMDDCKTGTLQFNSDRSDYGSGALPLKRLVRIKQIGCANPVAE